MQNILDRLGNLSILQSLIVVANESNFKKPQQATSVTVLVQNASNAQENLNNGSKRTAKNNYKHKNKKKTSKMLVEITMVTIKVDMITMEIITIIISTIIIKQQV